MNFIFRIEIHSNVLIVLMQNIIHLVKVHYGRIKNSIYSKLIFFVIFREIFIKTDNYIGGVFFADLLKVIFSFFLNIKIKSIFSFQGSYI
jgi:hypothetical protein